MSFLNKIFFFIIFFSFIRANAQDSLTFQECVAMAFKNNLIIQNAEISQEISEYQHASAKSKVLPKINSALNNNFSWGRAIDPNTNSFINTEFKSYSGNIGSNITLFSGFSNINSIKLAKQEVEINKANIQKIKNEITIDIASKFTTILYLQEIIKSNEEQLQSTEKQVQLITLKFKAGYIPESEVFKIKSQKATEELVLTNNQNLLLINFIDLKQLLNLSLEKNIILVSPQEKLGAENKIFGNEFELINKAIDINLNYSISKLKEEKAKTNIAIYKASLFPTLNANFNYGSNYSNSNTLSFNDQLNKNLAYNVSFNLSIPVFSQFQNRFKIKVGNLLYDQSKIETKIEKNMLSKVILQAINDAKASIKKYQSSLSAFDFSNKSYQADKLKFEFGKISVNELTITKNTYTNAQAELIRAKYEMIFNQAIIEFYLGEEFSL
jgi:outer membrane protein